MKKKKEWKYLNKHWKKMQQQFTCFVQTQSPEALHGFRVQVKKIKSFFTLLQEDKKNEVLLKTFKPVKKIFKSAGIIRDAYIHNKQAKENNIHLPGLYKEQDALQKKEAGKLISRQKKHIRTMKKVKKELHNHLYTLSRQKIKNFFTEQLCHTQEVLSRHSFTEQLHNGRKMLKHLLYNKSIIPGGLAESMNFNFDYIDEMQQVLGNWHDNKLAMAFFGQKLTAEELGYMKSKQEELENTVAEKASGFSQKAILRG